MQAALKQNFQCILRKATDAQDQPIGKKMKNHKLVQWKGYIRVQAKRHIRNIHRHKSCWAEPSSDTLAALQGTIRISRGEEIYIPAHMKKKSFLPLSLPPDNNTNFYSRKKTSKTR